MRPSAVLLTLAAASALLIRPDRHAEERLFPGVTQLQINLPHSRLRLRPIRRSGLQGVALRIETTGTCHPSDLLIEERHGTLYLKESSGRRSGLGQYTVTVWYRDVSLVAAKKSELF